MRLIGRVWDVCVGLVMIALSACVQFIFLNMLMFVVYAIMNPYETSELASNPYFHWGCVALFALLFNGIACFEYFRRQRMAQLGGPGMRAGIHALKAVAKPDSGHIAWSIFLVPRGIDRIVFGKELSMDRSGTAGRRP